MELEISASSKIKSETEVTFTIYAKDLIDIVRKLPEKTKIKFKIQQILCMYLGVIQNTIRNVIQLISTIYQFSFQFT